MFVLKANKNIFVKHSTVLVSYESKDFVSAIYRCDTGFKSKGKLQISCDLDTDEWIEEPPQCEPGNFSAQNILK